MILLHSQVQMLICQATSRVNAECLNSGGLPEYCQLWTMTWTRVGTVTSVFLLQEDAQLQKACQGLREKPLALLDAILRERMQNTEQAPFLFS